MSTHLTVKGRPRTARSQEHANHVDRGKQQNCLIAAQVCIGKPPAEDREEVAEDGEGGIQGRSLAGRVAKEHQEVALRPCKRVIALRGGGE